MSTSSPKGFLLLFPVDFLPFPSMRGEYAWFAGFSGYVGVHSRPDFVNGGDNRIRPLKRNHVSAIGNHNSLSARGKMGFFHLQIIDPDLVEVVELLFWNTSGQLGRVPRFSRRQHDERLVAKVAGC